MAGTVTESREVRCTPSGKQITVVTLDWVADVAAATIPNTTVSDLYGFCVKAVTNPGSTAPTASYDITFGDPEDSALDALAGALQNRSATATEQVYPIASGAQCPILLAGDYTLTVTGNAVNSATGRIQLYLVDSL